MIRNEAEYQNASVRLKEEQTRLAEHRARLAATGMSEEAIRRVIGPIESFHLQLREEVEGYISTTFRWAARLAGVTACAYTSIVIRKDACRSSSCTTVTSSLFAFSNEE
jgi:hypothetical protein